MAKVALIAAVARNGAIGRENGLLWSLPDDLKRFRELTAGHPVVLGRKTFDSIVAISGKPLPKRMSLVVSRRPAPAMPEEWKERVRWCASLEEALSEAMRWIPEGRNEVFVLGGAEIYTQALPRADRLYLTEVDDEPSGDAFFPKWDRAEFSLVRDEPHPIDDRHAVSFRFRVYDRSGTNQ